MPNKGRGSGNRRFPEREGYSEAAGLESAKRILMTLAKQKVPWEGGGAGEP